MIQKKISISKHEFEEMLALAETSPTMLDALEKVKMIYEMLQTQEQRENKEFARRIVERMKESMEQSYNDKRTGRKR